MIPTFPVYVSFDVAYTYTAWTLSLLCGGIVTAFMLGVNWEATRFYNLVFDIYGRDPEQVSTLGEAVLKQIAETGELPRAQVIEAVRKTFRDQAVKGGASTVVKGNKP